MPIVSFRNTSLQYGNQLAIRECGIEVTENKTTAIVGKSGSGKSSLLKLINGLERPTTGEVQIFGERLNYQAIQTVRLRCGFMVQGSGLFPHLTVAENISVTGRLFSPPIINKSRVHELMSLVNLPSLYLSKFPHQLSGGEQQRVGICRALYLNPTLLLMDEPFGALDSITRSEIHQEIVQLQKLQPRTILLVTHDIREAKKLADYILVLDKGEVQQFDQAEKVLSQPANRAVEELINASLS